MLTGLAGFIIFVTHGRNHNVQAKSERDEHLVEYVVRRFGPISRARIHELTQIRPSATSQIVRHLLDEGRLLEDGVENGRLGRKGALLRINEESRIVAVLQFDDEAITAGIANLRPTIRKTSTRRSLDGEPTLIRQLVATMRGCPAGSRPSAGRARDADPGLVDSRRAWSYRARPSRSARDSDKETEREFGAGDCRRHPRQGGREWTAWQSRS
jgi:hypothetical protein